MNYSFKTLSISNNIKDYPESEKDTIEHPELLEYVDDEQEGFVYCNETGDFWTFSDFFHCVKIEGFQNIGKCELD